MKRSMKTIMFGLMTFFVGMLPVFATYNGTDMGTVTENSGKDSVGSSNVNGVVNASNKQHVVITYNALDLKIIDANKDGKGRPADAAWVGFHITLPNSAEKDKAKSKFRENGNYEPFDQEGNYYLGITQEKLENALQSGEKISDTFYFDWNDDGTEDQTVEIIIDPAKVTLKEKNSENVTFDGPTLQREKEAAEQAQQQQQQTTKPQQPKETNPNTADINIYALVGLLVASVCGFVFVVRKRFN